LPTLFEMPILEIENLSKEYALGQSFSTPARLREFLWRKVGRSAGTPDVHSGARSEQHFWALRDLTFAVSEGDVVAIIGRNGAGKSTLLKIISRITDPTEGSVTLRARMASLLEVGTGFHPELTGRENVFLNGAILGMKRAEIISKFDEIVAFAEIQQFLDTPVKHYSSGMYVRLAFAVAAHLNPEILVVDEVLAVGDMAFQKKCLGKMDEVSQGGRTVLFVSHNMAAVENLCRRGIVLDQGNLVFQGTAKEAVHYYLNSMSSAHPPAGHVVEFETALDRCSAKEPLLKRLELYSAGGRPATEGLQIGSLLLLRVHFELPDPTADFDVGIGFNNAYGQRVFTAHSSFDSHRPAGKRTGPQMFTCEIPRLTLTPGEYTLRIWLEIENKEADLINDAARVVVVESDYYGTGKVPWNGNFVLKHHWYSEQPASRDNPK
jgi:homopolymeric O-antigen transport system ATP-binding protein